MNSYDELPKATSNANETFGSRSLWREIIEASGSAKQGPVAFEFCHDLTASFPSFRVPYLFQTPRQLE